MTITDSSTTLRSLINERLEALLPKREGLHFLLFEGAHYSLMLPGKRLRPLFLLSCLKDFSAPIEKGLDVACALEMIHTYSLIHDDLPCMDDDDLRRGKPALHKVYGEGQAILVGDFLLTYAFEILATCGAPQEVTALIAKAAGGHGMIGGQLVDILFEGKSIDWEILQFMYLGKTAALFSAALECGALLSGASDIEQAALKECGALFGMAFQMQDDILDVTSDTETLGKPAGSDAAQGKSNVVTLLGLEKAQALAQEYHQKALDVLPLHCHTIKSLLTL
ncbi:MAG: polyprenyl synthetase family protein [Chlamydiia bacterium]|nr:polyprenyl synthetase family protein [Chlamydiia bacterium]